MKLFAAILATLFVSTAAHADLYLEPYLGYETGKFEMGNGSENLSGTSIGLKLAYESLGFAGGLDLMRGSVKIEGDSSSLANQDVGLFAQFTFPILVKVSGAYIVSTELSNSDGKYTGSGGTKIGVGFTGLPFVSINLDMINMNYNKREAGGSSADADADRKTYMLSVSLPLSL